MSATTNRRQEHTGDRDLLPSVVRVGRAGSGTPWRGTSRLAACLLVGGSFVGCGGTQDLIDPGLRDAGHGLLLVSCEPQGATVVVDERPVRIVDEPVEELRLPAGPYRVTLTADGYLTGRYDVVLEPGRIVDLSVVLWPVYPSVDVLAP